MGVDIEGATDVLKLYADLITAPFMALFRVMSDFVHNEGHYKRSNRRSPRSH